jgi:hypothetical protein
MWNHGCHSTLIAQPTLVTKLIDRIVATESKDKTRQPCQILLIWIESILIEYVVNPKISGPFW